MTTWTAPAFIEGLQTSVAARSAITALSDPAVRVLDYSPAGDEPRGDIIVIGYEAEDNKEHAAFGNSSHREIVILRCAIEVIRPGAGAEKSAAARTRAAFLLGEVDAQLREDSPAVGDQTERARLSSRHLFQFASNDSRGSPIRVCLVDFEIEYSARTS